MKLFMFTLLAGFIGTVSRLVFEIGADQIEWWFIVVSMEFLLAIGYVATK
jgi:hypothetical protein